MKDVELRKVFWEKQHAIKNITALSGCTFDETVDFLQVRNLLKPDIKVLEVGVGIGSVTKGLYDCGCFVSALDISELALKRVYKFCEKV